MEASRWAPAQPDIPNSSTPASTLTNKELPSPTGGRPQATPTHAPAHAPPNSYDDQTPFAQTGGEASDLFADDFTPITQPVAQPVPPEAPRSSVPQHQLQNQHQLQSQHPHHQPNYAHHEYFRHSRGERGGRRGRGRGRGGRAVPPPVAAQLDSSSRASGADKARIVTEKATSPSSLSPSAATAAAATTTAAAAAAATATATNNASETAPEAAGDDREATADSLEGPVTAAALPAVPSKPNSTAAVRGDRIRTGGIARPKLTEEELSAKLEAVRLNNEKRERAHQAAEADEANFRKQEAEARERRKEEALSRRQMEAEREKNRARKMAGRGGREWDENKEDGDAPGGPGRGRGRRFRRGAHGAVVGEVVAPDGVTGEQQQDFELMPWELEAGEPRFGRHRGDRAGRMSRPGRARGRGRGQGGREGTFGGRGDNKTRAPDLGAADFPALGEAKSPVTTVTKELPHANTDEQSTEALMLGNASATRGHHVRSPWRAVDESKTSWADAVEEGI